MQNYDVEIFISNRIAGSITVSAENPEEAEDLASELIKLTAKKSYDKTSKTEEPTTTPEERPLPETTK
jgi:capsular polysaccharide biosynthesis protein